MITLPNHLLTDNNLWGLSVQHSPIALWVLENILNTYKPEIIIEIGTGFGGVTVYLGTWARLNSARVLSIDHKDYLKNPKYFIGLPVNRIINDAFCNDTRACVRKAAKHRCLIYCDGGNKTKELAVFSKFVRTGSVIGCHDYTTEVFPANVDDYMDKNNFSKVVNAQQMRQLFTLQMFWEKTA